MSTLIVYVCAYTRTYTHIHRKGPQKLWRKYNFVGDEVCGQARVRPINKLDEACTNADDRMMLVPMCNTASATASWLAWIWTDFLREQCQATGLVETAGRATRASGKRQPARCSRKNQDKFAIAFMAKHLLHRCICAHARVHVHFCEKYECILTGVVGTMHVQVCALDRCCEHQRTHLLTPSLQDVQVRSCICSLFI